MAKQRGSNYVNLYAAASTLELLLHFDDMAELKSGLRVVIAAMYKGAKDSPEWKRHFAKMEAKQTPKIK